MIVTFSQAAHVALMLACIWCGRSLAGNSETLTPAYVAVGVAFGLWAGGGRK